MKGATRPIRGARTARVKSQHTEGGKTPVQTWNGVLTPFTVDCRSAHSKNALKTPLESQSIRALARFSPPLRCPATEAAAAPDTPFLIMRSRAAEPRSARSGHKTRLPPSVEAGVAEEPKDDTQVGVRE